MMTKSNIKVLIRTLIIELLIYGMLLIAYFFAVLRYFNDILTELFENQLVVYAFLGLGLIIVQAVFLEALTSYLIRLLRLDRLG